jgi:hypothetical protein
MKEIVTIDGKQFELDIEYPLTEQQRQQTILDIRKQIGCSTCNKTQSLENGIQTLSQACVDVVVKAPTNITLTSIVIGGQAACSPGSPGTCPSITCIATDCVSMTADVVVTFGNSGDIDGIVTPTISVRGGTAIPHNPVSIPVLANGSAIATWANVVFNRGPTANSVCVNY